MIGRLRRRLHRARRKLVVMRLPRRSGTHLTLRNCGGSVQHYHHFLYGFLVPLVHAWPRLAVSGAPVLVRSCAVMDPLLRALPMDGLSIMDAAEHAALRDDTDLRRGPGRGLTFETANGHDYPSAYDARVFADVRTTLFRWLEAEVAQERAEVAALFPGGGPRVLLIDRLPPDPFYLSTASEAKGAGTQRRSVPNMAALAETARAEFGGAALVTLEGRSLPFQLALFDAADIIMAQHGAALSNLLWARPGTRVIEILPEEKRTDPRNRDYFGDLSRCLGLRHDRLLQDASHSPVDPQALAALFAGWRKG